MEKEKEADPDKIPDLSTERWAKIIDATPVRRGNVCDHGALIRQCEICDRDARIAELEAEVRRGIDCIQRLMPYVMWDGLSGHQDEARSWAALELMKRALNK